MSLPRRPPAAFWAVLALLVALFLQLALAASRNSASWDEPAHVYTGYLQWRHGLYTLNPPLARYLIAAPLAGMRIEEPSLEGGQIRDHEIKGGREFLFHNDADAILLRSRMVVVALGVLLALLVFVATRRMFGLGAGLVALGLLAFDPTLLAHSSLATTDTAQALFMFLSIYAFYRYVEQPCARRMAALGGAVGLAVATKTSAVLILPMLGLLAIGEVIWGRTADAAGGGEPRLRRAARLTLALAVAALSSVAILWAAYGFHYLPVGAGVPIEPMDAELARVPSALAAKLLGTVDRLHLLPQAYTYGFAHFLYEANAFTSYVFGTTYPHAVWFFFPVAMAVKSSLTFLALLGIAAWALVRVKMQERRGLLYLAIPAAVYMVFAMAGGMNIGVRHVLPVYVFAAAGMGGVLSLLVRRSRRWLWTIALLLLFQAVSVTRVFPSYISYANELAGGPAKVHRLLSDSSADWGQQLKSVKRYLDAHGIRECWFAYFGQSPIDYAYYGITCKPLPTGDSLYFDVPRDVPAAVDGPVLMSAAVLSGFEFGPPPLNPYEQFKDVEPVDVIDYSVFVFRGHFAIPLAAALGHVQKARALLAANDLQGALVEARQAEELAPDSATVIAMLGHVAKGHGERAAAIERYRKALRIAESVHPEFQHALIAELRKELDRER